MTSTTVWKVCFQSAYLLQALEREISTLSWPRVHKAFQNQDQDQAQVKHYFTMDILKTHNTVGI